MSGSGSSELPRVMALAYGYGETDVSESYTAFALTREIALHCRLTVVTKDRGAAAPELEACLRLAGRAGRAADSIWRQLKLDYFAFNYRAWRMVRSGRVGPFDICHHVSPISLRYPDLLATLDVPFIWGPVGGSLPYPAGFETLAAREGRANKLRGLDLWRLRNDPTLRITMRRARRIVVTTTAARDLLPRDLRGKLVVLPEGVHVGPQPDATRAAGFPYVFSSCRMVPFKGIEFLLRAFAATTIPRLVVTGDGPERARLERLAGDLGLGGRLRLLGKVSKEQNQTLMRDSLFCVFPSVREAFGHVNLEAMVQGRAVVACGYGGPRDIVEDGVTGLLVPPGTPDDYVAGLGTAMMRLYANPSLCETMGQAGWARAAEKFSWAAIGRDYSCLYREVIAESREGA